MGGGASTQSLKRTLGSEKLSEPREPVSTSSSSHSISSTSSSKWSKNGKVYEGPRNAGSTTYIKLSSPRTEPPISASSSSSSPISSSSRRGPDDGEGTHSPRTSTQRQSPNSPKSRSPTRQSTPPSPSDYENNSKELRRLREAIGSEGDDIVNNNVMDHYDHEYDDYHHLDQSPCPSPHLDPETQAQADMFMHTAMSLEMEGDDLLFNLMYFSQKEKSHKSGGGDGMDHLDDTENEESGYPGGRNAALLDLSRNFGGMINSALEETLALHSEHNTPYKLRPASEYAIRNLSSEVYTPGKKHGKVCGRTYNTQDRVEGKSENDDDEGESGVCGNVNVNVGDDEDVQCLVCRDDFTEGCELTRLICGHRFHKECVVRWFSLQGVCPVCRADISIKKEAVAMA